MKYLHTHLPKTLPSFIWHFLKPYKRIVAIFIALPILAGLWDPFNNILIKEIIDLLPQVYKGEFSRILWPTSLIALNFIIFDNFTWRSMGYINSVTSKPLV